MSFFQSVRILCLAAIASLAISAPASAQKNPSPAALLLATELISVKGATRAFDPIIKGVIEYHVNVFTQSNPTLSGELRKVAQKLLAEMAPRQLEVQQKVVHAYAGRFSEKELKDALAFYRTPLGQKLIKEEPIVLEQSMKELDEWSKKFAVEISAKMRAEMKKRGFELI